MENNPVEDKHVLREFEPRIRKKKRGRVYFWIGIALISFQLLGYLGTSLEQGRDVMEEQSFSFWIGYNLFILVGGILVLVGIRRGI